MARRGRLISVETAGSEVVAVATVDRAKTCRRRAENLFYALSANIRAWEVASVRRWLAERPTARKQIVKPYRQKKKLPPKKAPVAKVPGPSAFQGSQFRDDRDRSRPEVGTLGCPL